MKTFIFKLYNSKHNDRLMRLMNVAGLIYNHCVALHRHYYRLYGRHLDLYRLQKHITKLKKTRRFSYIRQLNAQAVQNIAERIEHSYNIFWRNIKHKIKASLPHLQKVKQYKSFTLKQAGWKLDEAGSSIIICGHRYRYFNSRKIEGRIKTVTVKRDLIGNVYICLACDTDSHKSAERTGKIVGYDFGLKKFLTASDGKDLESPLFFTSNAKILAEKHKILSRRTKDSHRWESARKELARAYKHTANQRRDFHFKTALAICREYTLIALEDLNIKGMTKRWGRKILDLGFYNFVQILRHEAIKTGARVLQVGRSYPSSQICSVCGNKNPEVRNFKLRLWTCPQCGAEHDKDRNAAKNILHKVLDDLH